MCGAVVECSINLCHGCQANNIKVNISRIEILLCQRCSALVLFLCSTWSRVGISESAPVEAPTPPQQDMSVSFSRGAPSPWLVCDKDLLFRPESKLLC